VATPVRLTIRGSDASGNDAPTVDDLLGQIEDFVEVLRGVEKAVADGGGNALVWRVTNVTMNSPISMEITPFSTNPAIYIDARAALVALTTRDGLRAMATGTLRPNGFTDEVLPKARKLQARVLNGLEGTMIDFDPGSPGGEVDITPETARAVAATVEASKPIRAPYREIGSLEGFVARAERDGFGRGILQFRRRLDREMVKAVATGDAFRQLEKLQLREVWEGVRVRVYGVLHFKDLGDLDHIDASGIELMDQVQLPTADEIVDTGFTGGMATEAYLAEIRYG